MAQLLWIYIEFFKAKFIPFSEPELLAVDNNPKWDEKIGK